eukprot:scaffold16438_cov144-Isochrysis_galbana.AAC.3
MDVEALLAVAAEFPRPGESAADGLRSPFVFFLTGSPGFGVEARAHIEEKAFGVVGAAHVEGGYSPTAGAIWADMLTLAPPTAQKLRVTRGAATWASTAARRRRSAARRYRWQPLDRRHKRGSPLASRRSA